MSRCFAKDEYREETSDGVISLRYNQRVRDAIMLSSVSPKVKPVYLKGGRMLKGKQEIVSVWIEDRGSFYFPLQVCRNILGHTATIRNAFTQHCGYPINQIKLRDYQEPAMAIALKHVAKFQTLLIKFPPGFGKTIVAMTIWRYIRMNVVILINKVALIKSWKSTIESCFGKGLKVWIVGDNDDEMFGKKKRDNGGFANDGEEQEWISKMPDIMICMAQRTQKIPSEWRSKVGVMIVDEGHLFCTKSHISPLLSFQPNFIIFATATPIRENEMEKMIDLFVDRKSWINIISQRPYIVHKIYTGVSLEKECKKNKVESTFGNKYSSAHQSLKRNEQIVELAVQAFNQGRKSMILSTTTAHIDTLSEMLQDHEELNGACMAEKYYKSMKECDNYNILLGTVPKVGVGYDEATACNNFDGVKSNVLILCTSVKSLGLFEQLVGRVMRSDNPHVVVLIDDDHTPLSHFKALEPYIDMTRGVIRDYMFNSTDEIDFTEQLPSDGVDYKIIEQDA